MNLKIKNKIPLIVALALLVACNKPMGELVGTGAKGSFSDAHPYGMVFIERGTFTMGSNDESLFNTNNQPPVKVTLNPFWMDETEITNDEYRQFVNWVRDSIALRALVVAGLDEYRKPIKGDEDEPTPEKALLNWKKKIPWNSKDEEIQDLLKFMYFPKGVLIGKDKQINPSKLKYIYTWYDYTQASLPANNYDIQTGRFPEGAMVRKDSGYVDENGVMHNITKKVPLKSQRDFYQSKVLNIYPDTAVWTRDFQYTYNDPKVKMYFSHGAFSQYPVVGVTWEQAVAFCNWRTQLYYRTVPTAGQEFRLPSEAEWEYAARGGRELALYPWGGNYIRDSKGCYLANFKPAPNGFDDDSGKITMPVASFAPNNYGLYDMAGNVAEWTSSAYGSNFNIQVETNPNLQYNAKNDDPMILKRKVVKGGSWKDVAYFLQCGVKTYQYQNESRPYIGFRCVRTYLGE